MGKHNKVNRKKYWKRRKRRFTGKGSSEVECSSPYSMTLNDSEDQTGHTCSFQNYLDTSDSGSENQNDHSCKNNLTSSDIDSEEQNIDGVVKDELTACSTDNDSDYSHECLDLNDPKVIKRFSQSKPTEDPLWVNMFVYHRNKRKLFKLLQNPLGVKY